MLATARIQESLLGSSAVPKRHNWHTHAAGGTLSRGLPSNDKKQAEFKLELVTTREGFDALESEWNKLFEDCGRDVHLFQNFNWIWHWANHYLPRDSTSDSSHSLYIVTGRKAGQLALVCPFVKQRRGGITTLSFAGDPVSQYGDVLLDETRGGRELLASAWAFITAQSGADVVALRKVRADSNLAQLLAGSDAQVTDRQFAPFLDLASAPDFQTYEQRYSGKARKNRRRLHRRLEDRGPASLSVLTGSERAGDMAALSITMKRAWLKMRGLISPALANPATRAFFAAIAADSQRPVGAVVTTLTSRGEAAAINVAFDCKGRRAAHILVYALKFERLGTGQILIEQCLRDAFKDGIGVYDLLAPGDAYKLDWADGGVEVLDWSQGLTLRGRAFATVYLGYGRAKLKHAALAASQFKRNFLNRIEGSNKA